jgi:hypothetical protein
MISSHGVTPNRTGGLLIIDKSGDFMVALLSLLS